MAMNTALVVSCFLVALLVYRLVMRLECLQRMLHAWSPAAALFFQYYTILLIMLFVLLSFTFYEIFSQEILDCGMLDPHVVRERLEDTLSSIPSMSRAEAERQLRELRITSDLRALSLSSPAAVALTYLVVVYHVWYLVSENNLNELEYFPTTRQDLILEVILLPAVYATMSLRCVVRQWMVMTAGGWEAAGAEQTWAVFDAQNRDQSEANYAVANFVEMYTVWCFSTLIMDVMGDYIAMPELHHTLQQVTMLGVNTFVGVGFFKAVCEILVVVLEERGAAVPLLGGLDLAATKRLCNFLTKLLTLASLQCLYAMTQICRLTPLQPLSPSVKFLGTRILIVCAQVQSAGLHVASQRYGVCSGHQAYLLHASLMCFECLGVAFLHCFAWPSEDFEQGYLPLAEGGDQDQSSAERAESWAPGGRLSKRAREWAARTRLSFTRRFSRPLD